MRCHKNWPQETNPQRRVSIERPDARPQKPARAGELQEKQQQSAPAKKRPRSLSQCQSKSRPHQSPTCRPHPKPRSPSKFAKTSKASAHERRLFPCRPRQAALPRDYFPSKTRITSVLRNLTTRSSSPKLAPHLCH